MNYGYFVDCDLEELVAGWFMWQLVWNPKLGAARLFRRYSKSLHSTHHPSWQLVWNPKLGASSLGACLVRGYFKIVPFNIALFVATSMETQTGRYHSGRTSRSKVFQIVALNVSVTTCMESQTGRCTSLSKVFQIVALDAPPFLTTCMKSQTGRCLVSFKGIPNRLSRVSIVSFKGISRLSRLISHSSWQLLWKPKLGATTLSARLVQRYSKSLHFSDNR
jgi:hypothetical protein